MGKFVIDGELFIRNNTDNNNNGIDVFDLWMEANMDEIEEAFDGIPEDEMIKIFCDTDEVTGDFVPRERGPVEWQMANVINQLQIVNGKYVMMPVGELFVYDAEMSSTVYDSVEALKADYTSLSDFLNDATFVGRKFKRTASIIESDGTENKKYMNPNEITGEYIVLYGTENFLLVKETSGISKDYSIIMKMEKSNFMDQFMKNIKIKTICID